jgi:hypothetical protein
MTTRFLTRKILLAAAAAIPFVFGVSTAAAQITFSLPQAFAIHRVGPTSLAAIDLDSDGDLDLVVANRVDSTLTLHLNDGAGTFMWLFRCLISASMHAHFQPIPHESSSYSRG